MTSLTRRGMAACLVVTAIAMAGCASKIRATRTDNPPPTEAYSNFGRIEIKPAVLAATYAASGENQKVLVKLQENLDKGLAPSLAEWNRRPDNGRKLVIEPVVEEVRFIGSAARVMVGPLAGSSTIRMTVKATDAATGKQVDNAEFYQRASAGSGFAFGVADNMMITRTADMASAYIIRNYAKAEGGPTGATEQLVAPAQGK
jgi:hypothetical protein